MKKSSIAFIMLISLALAMAFWIKGVVFSGVFMGVMSTIAVWVLILKLPHWTQKFIARHQLISDVAFTAVGASALAALGPGATVFMACITQMVLLSLLLKTLDTH